MNKPSIDQVAKFRHEALLYQGWAEFIAGTVPFIRDGLKSREPVLVVESAAKIDMLRTALGAEAEKVLFADMSAVGANPARIIPAWHEFVTVHGAPGRRMRGIGEPIWQGRSADELVECQRHESLLNVAFGHGEPWWLLCPYDVENLDPLVIEEARRSHEFVTGQNSEKRNELFRGIDASGAPFDQAGQPLRVPNVLLPPPGKAARVVVSRSDRSVEAQDAEGRTLAYSPATIGSDHDPLPVGRWKIRGVSRNPEFHYNPDLFWDAKGGEGKARIAPGPNNPVGVAWIDLSRRHYGIHGTPEPSRVGKSESHGCIRLTNWDVWELQQMVSPGTPALLEE